MNYMTWGVRMNEAFSRTEMLFGTEAMERLKSAHVAVFGLGGVGGYVVEALARSGIGALDLIDNDTFSVTNLNRQILALHSTVGLQKTDVAAKRVKDISPECRVHTFNTFFTEETSRQFDFDSYDYIVDAIDTMAGKLELVMAARRHNVPIICSMGTGSKMDPTALRVGDLYETSVDPLARIMRKELRKRGVDSLKVVCSSEMPIKPKTQSDETKGAGNRPVPGSNAFVPAAAGLILAGEVVKDITGYNS